MNRQILRYTIFSGLFLVPFIPFLVSSSFFFPFITTKAFTWRIIIEIVFFAWIILALLDTEYRPKKSLVSYAILNFLLIIGLADLFGVAPIKSFWSNFERMEGYITLLHLGMFFMVISSVFREVDWKRWWNTSLVASFCMVLYCVLQIIGLKTINQGGVRVDGTMGNAIYLAVYMLFHIFVAIFFLVRNWKSSALRWVYGLLIFTQLSVLYYTATRGAILGLLAGLLVIAILNIRNREDRLVRKASVALLIGLVVLVGGFYLMRNTDFVKGSPVLSRFSSLPTLNSEAIKRQGRYYVWPMAIEGFKDRPILGWGQENFSYVFQEYYNPEMYSLEPWFDRAHNIFLDWAVAGGLLGILSYLALYLALILSIWRRNSNLSHVEKSILTGLIAAYFLHNFFVFDHLISYILFFSLLGYVHSRTSGVPYWQWSANETISRRIVLPVASIIIVMCIYFLNIKPMMANVFLIEGLKSVQTPGEILSVRGYFEKAHDASRLGRPEVMEHLAANTVAVLTSDISMEEKNAFFAFAKDTILDETSELEKDARYQLIAGSFLSTVGFMDEALVHLERAKELIPNKQQIYFEIGAAYINKDDRQKALETFKEAYELAPEYPEAKIIYLIGAIYAGDRDLENRLIQEIPEDVVSNDYRILSAYKIVGR